MNAAYVIKDRGAKTRPSTDVAVNSIRESARVFRHFSMIWEKAQWSTGFISIWESCQQGKNRRFSGEKCELLESDSRMRLLTQSGRISQPKTSSLMGTQARTLSAGIMADIGRKNGLFYLPFWGASQVINCLAEKCCVEKSMQKVKIIMSQSHLFS